MHIRDFTKRTLVRLAAKAGLHLPRGQSAYMSRLSQLQAECDRFRRVIGQPSGPRILYGPAFSIYPPCFIHDRLLAMALALRGASISPVYCDGIQSTECNVYGGVWRDKNTPFAECCNNCTHASQRLWSGSDQQPSVLSQFIREADHREIETTLGCLGDEDWSSFEYENMPVGLWAKDITVNNYVVGDYHLIPKYGELGRIQVANLLLLARAYSRLLDGMRPDRVVSNDSYYGMWAVLQKLCEKRGIPFFSHWVTGGPRGYCYAFDDAAMNLDFRKAWPRFSAVAMSEEQEATVSGWLAEQQRGKNTVLDTSTSGPHGGDRLRLDRLSVEKPTSLLAANVIWDLAALNKQVVFSTMIDWIIQTIEWFRDRPDLQLIVKPHPAEMHPDIPLTEERVALALDRRGITVPDNVVILHPRSEVTVYELLPRIVAGLVHTTTAGLEMVAQGIPVVCSAKAPYWGFGFTRDPSTPQAYFEALECLCQSNRRPSMEEERSLVRKFILFYHFHYFMRMNWCTFQWGGEATVNVQSIEELLPGKSGCLDYVCDSILRAQPIVSETRWPPAS